MENKNQMQSGTWDKMSSEDYEIKPKVVFEVNITQKVVFLKDQPKECVGKDASIFYVFDVQQDKVDKIVMTSAWTLLHELKKLSPLNGKVVEITKKLVKGKQFFEVKVIELK